MFSWLHTAIQRLIERSLSKIQKFVDWADSQSTAGQVALIVTVFFVSALLWAGGSMAWDGVQRLREPSVSAVAKEDLFKLDTRTPVVSSPGSATQFLSTHQASDIVLVYLRNPEWETSSIMLVSSGTQQFAFLVPAQERPFLKDVISNKHLTDRLRVIPRARLSGESLLLVQSLERRLNVTPEAMELPTTVSAMLNGLLMVAMMLVLWNFVHGMRKRLKFVLPDQVQGSIDDLVGMDDIKKEVRQVKDLFERRAQYAEYGIARPFNVMFSGPAGTGKTKLASYLAKELNVPILFHSAANIETGYVNGGAQTLDRIAHMAQRRKRCIVFLDEAQDLFRPRGTGERFHEDSQNTLLSILDGVRTTHGSEVIWIVAMNFNQESAPMDEAMLRRFQLKIDFRTPNKEERATILRHYLARRQLKVDPHLDLSYVVDITEGRSPADLETIVDQAGISAGMDDAIIDETRLLTAAERVLVGNTTEAVTKHRERDRLRVARHEAGHFLVDFFQQYKTHQGDWALIAEHMKAVKISLKANARTNALGFVFHKQSDTLLKTRDDLEDDIRALLGGMANEELYYGEAGISNGAQNDISRVTQILYHAVGELGMYRKTRLNFQALQSNRQSSLQVDDDTKHLMEAQSERLYAETRALLEQYRAISDRLVEVLLAAQEITAKELLVLMRDLMEQPSNIDETQVCA